jgi:hypothetical protein
MTRLFGRTAACTEDIPCGQVNANYFTGRHELEVQRLDGCFCGSCLVDLPFGRLEMASYQIHVTCLDDFVGHDVDHPNLQRGWIRLLEKQIVDPSQAIRVPRTCIELAVPHGASELLYKSSGSPAR